MARIPYVRPESIPPEYSDVAARNINIYGALANNLECARTFRTMGRYIRNGSKLDAKLRELVTLQIGYLLQCPYEFYHHVKIGREAGVTDDEIRAVIADASDASTSLSQQQKLVLRFSRQLTLDSRVDDATYAAVAALFSREELVDLVATIGHFNSAVRVLNGFEVDLEEGYEAVVAAFPIKASR